jgi:hypothetical protein
LPAPSRSRTLPGWAALGPRAQPGRGARWSLRARPVGRQAPERPRSVVAPPTQVSRWRRATTTPVWPPWSVSGRARLLPQLERNRPRSATDPSPPGLRTTSAVSLASRVSSAVDGAARARGRRPGTRPTPAVKVACRTGMVPKSHTGGLTRTRRRRQDGRRTLDG